MVRISESLRNNAHRCHEDPKPLTEAQTRSGIKYATGVVPGQGDDSVVERIERKALS